MSVKTTPIVYGAYGETQEKNHPYNFRDTADFRRINKDWLKLAEKIAIRVLAVIEDFQPSEKYPEINNQIIARALRTDELTVVEILKGRENLTLSNIADLEKLLNIKLISFPDFKYNDQHNNYAQVQSQFNEELDN